ncbi:hypothetical protein [Actinomadura sp. 21ATH]
MSSTLLLLVMAPLAVLLLLMLMERLETALLAPDRPKHAGPEHPHGS